jgi:hypothetical protein
MAAPFLDGDRVTGLGQDIIEPMFTTHTRSASLRRSSITGT